MSRCQRECHRFEPDILLHFGNSKMNHIKTLTLNESGRDFVCGDIHGSLSCVERALNELNFDTTRDRLISVGDLVDRGPDSMGCLGLLDQEWFHAVRGNHEELMHDALNNREFWHGLWARNGGEWGTHLKMPATVDEAQLAESIGQRVDRLPYIISVPIEGGKKFHVIHAEFAFLNEITDQTLETWDRVKAEALTASRDGKSILWGRWIFAKMSRRALYPDVVESIAQDSVTATQAKKLKNPQLGRIYCGHTIVQKPVNFYGQINLDTGAYMSYDEEAPRWAGLTITEPATDRFWLVTSREFNEIKPVIFQ